MHQNGMIINNNQMVVKITAVYPYTPEPYTVSYNYIHETETTLVKTTTTNINGMRILGYAEQFPGD